jgi:hypothetical protein
LSSPLTTVTLSSKLLPWPENPNKDGLLTSCSVWGSADTKYIQEKDDDREKRNAIGTYEKSGLSQYTVRKEGVNYGTPESFPMNWEPRYAIAAGVGKSTLPFCQTLSAIEKHRD